MDILYVAHPMSLKPAALSVSLLHGDCPRMNAPDTGTPNLEPARDVEARAAPDVPD